MAKFVYKMQNILNIKMRLETQAKTEFSQASARLDEEEDKLRSLILRRRTYEDELKNASNDKLDINKLKQYNNYIAVIKELMEKQALQVRVAQKNTWLAGKIKCGHCGYALKATHVPNSTGYFRCTKRTENKGCPGCGKIRKEEFEQFIFSAMQEKFKDFQILHGREEKVNPKLTAYQVELAQVEAEIEKLLDTLTGANATLLAYANKKIEELDTRRQTISKAIAELSVETISPQQIKKLSYYLDNWDSIDFDDKRKAADGLISTIKATSDRVQIEWKI